MTFDLFAIIFPVTIADLLVNGVGARVTLGARRLDKFEVVVGILTADQHRTAADGSVHPDVSWNVIKADADSKMRGVVRR